MKEILVLFGGRSVEHDVSVITGVLTLNTIDKNKYLPVPVYVDKYGEWYTGEQLFDLDEFKGDIKNKLKKVTLITGNNNLYTVKNNKKLKKLNTISVCINCMHGGSGEDGSYAGLLKACGIPIASPSVLPSAVCMDKSFTKTVMKGLGVKTLPSVTVKNTANLETVISHMEFPLIVKPNTTGSSIGVEKADDINGLNRAVQGALSYSEEAIIETCLTDFIEINCAVYKDASGKILISECERPIGKDKILSFSDKYKEGDREFPAKLPKSVSERIKKISKHVYEGLKMDGVMRADFFVGKDKTVYLNEINTVPGSLAYYLFSENTDGFRNMLSEMIEYALTSFAKSLSVKSCFDSSLLTSLGAKSAKRL